jgi:hypothetical protein
MSPIGGAFQQLQISQAEAKAQEEAARAAASTIPQTPELKAMAETPTTTSERPPQNARNYQRWTSPKGVKYQFVNNKWKKV